MPEHEHQVMCCWDPASRHAPVSSGSSGGNNNTAHLQAGTPQTLCQQMVRPQPAWTTPLPERLAAPHWAAAPLEPPAALHLLVCRDQSPPLPGVMGREQARGCCWPAAGCHHHLCCHRRPRRPRRQGHPLHPQLETLVALWGEEVGGGAGVSSSSVVHSSTTEPGLRF